MPQRRLRAFEKGESLYLSFVSNNILRATYLDKLTQEADNFKVFINFLYCIYPSTSLTQV